MKIAPLLVPFLASCAALPSATSPQDMGVGGRKLTLLFGERELDEDDYEPVEDQTAVGLAFSWEPEDSGLGGEFGVYRSEEDDELGSLEAEASTTELFGGVRQNFGGEALRPFVGAGVSWIESKVEIDDGGNSDSDDDSGAGLYVHGGLDAWISPQVALGVEYRMLLGTDLTLFGEDTDADYGQVTFSIGFSF